MIGPARASAVADGGWPGLSAAWPGPRGWSPFQIESGRTHKAWLRYSNAAPEVTPDHVRDFRGSRFAEVRDAIFGRPYYRVWGASHERPLPHYPVSLCSVLQGILPGGMPHRFRQAAERTLDSLADLRWGPKGRGFRRLSPETPRGRPPNDCFMLPTRTVTIRSVGPTAFAAWQTSKNAPVKAVAWNMNALAILVEFANLDHLVGAAISHDAARCFQSEKRLTCGLRTFHQEVSIHGWTDMRCGRMGNGERE